ncbi:response regulator transcription factor [Flavisphingomonas formosensis]|uniref:response regulator transcription factor n=1 Tax=Flavisphingomonas formosensis TaxID=861534 RepID=UPI0012FCBB1B|nr:response regulator [Sphingomonas formosensis]
MDSARTIYIVDEDVAVRRSLGALITEAGLHSYPFSCGEDLLDDLAELPVGCIVMEVDLPGLGGLEVQRRVSALRPEMPVILMSAEGTIRMAVAALKAGAFDFLEKPIADRLLLDVIRSGCEQLGRSLPLVARKREAQERVGSLSVRERETVEHIAGGLSNKLVARTLGLSIRTVEMHRASAMRKLGVRNLAELLQLAGEADLLPDRLPSSAAA